MKGFTLVEILVGVGLFGLLLTTANVIMFSSLRSARKSAVVAVAKAEEAFALGVIARAVKYATTVRCPDANTLVVRTEDGTTITTVTYGYNSGGSFLESGGGRLTSNQVVVTVPGDCVAAPGVFRCEGKQVSICFAVNVAVTSDVTDTAGPGGVRFETRVTGKNL